jgi:amicyanin
MKPIFALTIAGSVLIAPGCSSHAPDTQSASPSVSFQQGMTPGMSGHSMPGMQPPPASVPAATGSSVPQGETAVAISDFKFNPATLSVPVGATVTWTNQDEEPHTIASKDGSFHSPGLDTHGSYSFTFTTPGSYDYICSIHPFMTGTVVVTK